MRTLLTQWRARPRAERGLLAVAGVVVGVHATAIAIRRLTQAGDFDVSREFGRRFLVGEPLYAGGLHYPYMPAAGMLFAPLALVPAWLGFAVRYAFALACLSLTLRLLAAMVMPTGENARAQRAVVAGVSLLLTAHYVVRDLDDSGPHLILLAILIAGLHSAWRGRMPLAALCFGLAAAVKAPAALLLALPVWKRQWRLAAYAVAAATAWICLPALWMGRATWWMDQTLWARTALASATGHSSGGAKESEDRIQNQALRAVIVRVLQPESFDGSALDDQQLFERDSPFPGRVATAAILALVAIVAWRSRKPYTDRHDPNWLLDGSVLLTLSLLLSPVTWTQHLVLLLPGLYLIVARSRMVGRTHGVTRAALGLYVLLALVLNREVLGRERYLTLLAYGEHTIAVLVILAVLLAYPPADPMKRLG